MEFYDGGAILVLGREVVRGRKLVGTWWDRDLSLSKAQGVTFFLLLLSFYFPFMLGCITLIPA